MCSLLNVGVITDYNFTRFLPFPPIFFNQMMNTAYVNSQQIKVQCIKKIYYTFILSVQTIVIVD